MSDKEMTTVVLHALPKGWGSFTTSIYGKKEATPFQDVWSLCKIEETKLKEKIDMGSNEENQDYAAMTRRKGRFGKFCPQRKRRNMDKIQWMNLGTIRRIVPNLIRTRGKRKKSMSSGK